jgi:hypothetical protein
MQAAADAAGSTALSEAENMRLVAARGVSDAPLPLRYEAAKRELSECERVDECATWAEKA